MVTISCCDCIAIAHREHACRWKQHRPLASSLCFAGRHRTGAVLRVESATIPWGRKSATQVLDWVGDSHGAHDFLLREQLATWHQIPGSGAHNNRRGRERSRRGRLLERAVSGSSQAIVWTKRAVSLGHDRLARVGSIPLAWRVYLTQCDGQSPGDGWLTGEWSRRGVRRGPRGSFAAVSRQRCPSPTTHSTRSWLSNSPAWSGHRAYLESSFQLDRRGCRSLS